MSDHRNDIADASIKRDAQILDRICQLEIAIGKAEARISLLFQRANEAAARQRMMMPIFDLYREIARLIDRVQPPFPTCERCNHKTTSHAMYTVHPHERECMEPDCSCPAFVVCPGGLR